MKRLKIINKNNLIMNNKFMYKHSKKKNLKKFKNQ